MKPRSQCLCDGSYDSDRVRIKKHQARSMKSRFIASFTELKWLESDASIKYM